MKQIATLSVLLALWTGSAIAQEWTTSEQTPVWTSAPVIGDGVDRFDEISTTEQGGDPPALAYEPAPIDENGTYTRSQWLGGTPSRADQGEGKFRTTCNFSHFGVFDPIVYHGQNPAGHHHTFIGNKNTGPSSTYASLRAEPGSTCAGGPLNGTAYWESTLMYEVADGISIGVKPNIVTFYYRTSYKDAPKLYRLPRGFAFVGGVDPSDRLSTAVLAEIPDNAGWDKTQRYNGFAGWACFNGGSVVPLAGGNTADENPRAANYARQLVNADGSDPWGGACEGAGNILIADVNAPGCWDGHNLTSPTGRRHVRYAIRKSDNSLVDACPTGWWRVPVLEAKAEFPNGNTALGVHGHAWRSKLYLSSDRMDPNPDKWEPRGSTFHFDWMNGWDSVIMNTWLIHCVGVAIDGTAGDPLTCNDSTISATQKMISVGRSPDPTLSNDPIVSLHTYYREAPKDAFGPVQEGTTVNATIQHAH
jgi:hypothetical protein